MRRLAPLLAAIAAIAAAAVAALAAEEPPGSEFIDTEANGQEFAIQSTKAFDVEGPLKTKVVQTTSEKNPAASDPRNKQGSAVLWARRCTPERQRLVFKRKVFFAGPEYKLGAGLSLFRGTNAVFKSAKLSVNGHVLLKTGPGGGSFERTADRSKVFVFGLNHIEVVVVKKANPVDKPCNTSLAPGKFTGVFFTIFGEHGGDMSLPPQQAEEYRRLEEGAFGVGVPLEFSMRNNGPGGLPRGPLNVEIKVPVTGEPPGYLLQVSDPETPFESCKATPPAGQVREGTSNVHCIANNMRSGATARQTMRVAFLMPPGMVRPYVFVRWSSFVPEAAEADHTDNERTKTIWFCKASDPDPKCPGEPSG